ncbi:MAG: creatininase family protein [Firmicutes bacterium]|nr:creatininase family protein [Bacillota bacterium]
MRLETLFPFQLREAIEKRWPLVIPAGTIEYHGEHLGFGTDTLVVTRILELLEKEKDMILAPPIYYGPSSYAVAGPEQGTIHVDVDNFEHYVRDVLWGMLLTGFRNIYVVIHHQYENGIELPEALCFIKSARQLIFRFLEEKHGRGWWGRPENARFYETLDKADNPWNWIKVIPLMAPEVQQATGYDHAGQYETSLMIATCPEGAAMNQLKEGQPWFVQMARHASQELGQRMVQLILDQLRKVIV